MRRYLKLILLFLSCFFLVGSQFSRLNSSERAQAAPGDFFHDTLTQFSSDPSSVTPTVSNEVCLGCHGEPGLTMPLSNGEILDLYVNPDHYADSVHGKGEETRGKMLARKHGLVWPTLRRGGAD